MNLLWNVIIMICLIVVLIVETISSKEIWLYNCFIKSGLPVIKKRDSTLQLAIPQKYNLNKAAYFYNNEIHEDLSREKFMLACPVVEAERDFWYPNAEEILKTKAGLSQDSKLLIMHEYEPSSATTCLTKIVPTIKKEKKEDSNGNLQYCGHFEAEIYHVGYPVVTEDKKDVQFMSIYEICYSKREDEGIQYTVHSTASPNLLLREIWDYFELNPNVLSLKSPLEGDETNKNKSKSIHKYDMHKYFAYQFVGLDDMPIKPWQHTTLLHFNFALISKNNDVLEGMLAADNYIRLFSRKMNKRLLLYSGVFKKKLKIPRFLCFAPFCKPEIKRIHSFWRIIMDVEGYAVIMVTQHTQIKCAYDHYICHENRKVILQYKKGGCTYTCSVDNEVLELLGLSLLQIFGELNMTIPEKTPTNEKTPLLQVSSKAIKPKYFSISDFLGKGTFSKILQEIDPDLASNINIIAGGLTATRWVR